MRATFIAVLLVSIAAVGALPVPNADNGAVAVRPDREYQPVHRLVRRAWGRNEPEYPEIERHRAAYHAANNSLTRLRTAQQTANSVLDQAVQANPGNPNAPAVQTARTDVKSANHALIDALETVSSEKNHFNAAVRKYNRRTRLPVSDCPPL